MPGLKGFLFKHWDSVGWVRRAINDWTPSEATSEAVVQDELNAHLQERLSGLIIRTQFPHDRIKADFLIEDSLAIEVKLNLTHTREFQRLIGQLETYARWGKDLVVLIVGDADPDMKERILDRLRSDWDQGRYDLIQVPLAED